MNVKTGIAKKISAKTMLVVVVFAVLIGVSLIISNLLPGLPVTTSTDCSSYYTTQTGTNPKNNTTFTINVPTNGICVHGGAISVKEDSAICSTCVGYGPGDYTAWCQTPISDCRAPNLTTVNALVDGAAQARDRIIRELNDGAKTTQEISDLFLLSRAGNVNLTCVGVVTSDYLGTQETINLKNNQADTTAVATPFLKMSIDGATVEGTVPLIQKFSIMWSRMFNRPSGNYGLCSRLPASCHISSSYRANEYGNLNGQMLLTPHGRGEAMDIACDVPSSTSGCTGDAATALSLIKQYNEGFTIIQECTPTERSKCGDGVLSVQVIHLDLGGPNRVPSPSGGQCLYANCDFSKCNPA